MSGPPTSLVASLAARAAGDIPGVVRLDAGPLRTKATYSTGGKVDGVTVDPVEDGFEVTVHVAVAYGEAIPALADRVDDAVVAALTTNYPDLSFTVALDVLDVEMPSPSAPAPSQSGLAALPAVASPATPPKRVLL